MGEVVADEALLNPCLVLMEGAGAAWGGLWGDVTLLAVAMEVALDAAFAHVERLSGLLEGHSEPYWVSWRLCSHAASLGMACA